MQKLTALPTTGYAHNLIRLVFEEVVHDPQPFVDSMKEITVPPPLSAAYDRPDKEEAIASHVSRFSRGVV